MLHKVVDGLASRGLCRSSSSIADGGHGGKPTSSLVASVFDPGKVEAEMRESLRDLQRVVSSELSMTVREILYKTNSQVEMLQHLTTGAFAAGGAGGAVRTSVARPSAGPEVAPEGKAWAQPG